mmetsp:Transcript_48218/g.120768  ORF Transcript_48218/g.120768 Transcript_48218/m.120768 type:complete len:225 (+) Transcript_48218:700-1374(+)
MAATYRHQRGQPSPGLATSGPPPSFCGNVVSRMCLMAGTIAAATLRSCAYVPYNVMPRLCSQVAGIGRPMPSAAPRIAARVSGISTNSCFPKTTCPGGGKKSSMPGIRKTSKSDLSTRSYVASQPPMRSSSRNAAWLMPKKPYCSAERSGYGKKKHCCMRPSSRRTAGSTPSGTTVQTALSVLATAGSPATTMSNLAGYPSVWVAQEEYVMKRNSIIAQRELAM